MFNSFWIPQFKWQLVELLSKIYPDDKSKFKRYKKKKLYAILFSIRKEN